jgi:hypothetical protein
MEPRPGQHVQGCINGTYGLTADGEGAPDRAGRATGSLRSAKAIVTGRVKPGWQRVDVLGNVVEIVIIVDLDRTWIGETWCGWG